jgi:hypothetical protein
MTVYSILYYKPVYYETYITSLYTMLLYTTLLLLYRGRNIFSDQKYRLRDPIDSELTYLHFILYSPPFF